MLQTKSDNTKQIIRITVELFFVVSSIWNVKNWTHYVDFALEKKVSYFNKPYVTLKVAVATIIYFLAEYLNILKFDLPRVFFYS